MGVRKDARLKTGYGSRLQSRVALLQILPNIVDRVAEQLGHPYFGEFRRAVAYGLKNPPVLMQAVVLYPRGALPAELEGAFERRANEAAESGEKVISGGLEDPHVEVEIRANQIAGAVLELVHAAIGVGDPVDRGA